MLSREPIVSSFLPTLASLHQLRDTMKVAIVLSLLVVMIMAEGPPGDSGETEDVARERDPNR